MSRNARSSSVKGKLDGYPPRATVASAPTLDACPDDRTYRACGRNRRRRSRSQTPAAKRKVECTSERPFRLQTSAGGIRRARIRNAPAGGGGGPVPSPLPVHGLRWFLQRAVRSG